MKYRIVPANQSVESHYGTHTSTVFPSLFYYSELDKPAEVQQTDLDIKTLREQLKSGEVDAELQQKLIENFLSGSLGEATNGTPALSFISLPPMTDSLRSLHNINKIFVGVNEVVGNKCASVSVDLSFLQRCIAENPTQELVDACLQIDDLESEKAVCVLSRLTPQYVQACQKYGIDDLKCMNSSKDISIVLACSEGFSIDADDCLY